MTPSSPPRSGLPADPPPREAHPENPSAPRSAPLPSGPRRIDLLLAPGQKGELALGFVPAKRQRLKSASFDLANLQLTSPTARGTRLAAKPVAKVQLKKSKTRAPSRKAAGKKPALTHEIEENGQRKLL